MCVGAGGRGGELGWGWEGVDMKRGVSVGWWGGGGGEGVKDWRGRVDIVDLQ